MYAILVKTFADVKEVIAECIDQIKKDFGDIDDRIALSYAEKGPFEMEMVVAGDTLVFHMHTNIFQFDSNSSLMNTSYLSDDPMRGYCGIISIYNFLTDSFLYQRNNDVGYMIGRVFINSEKHYFVQGKRQLGFLYNDFINSKISKQELRKIIHSAILYAIDFDLYTPPYNNVKEVTISQLFEMNQNDKISTEKRLGFKFQADLDDL